MCAQGHQHDKILFLVNFVDQQKITSQVIFSAISTGEIYIIDLISIKFIVSELASPLLHRDHIKIMMKPLIGKPSDFLMMASIPIQNKPI
jgi:hypothetical protein